MNKVTITAQVDKELDRRLRMAAAQGMVSKSTVIRLAVESYLSQLEKEIEEGGAVILTQLGK